MSERKIYRLLTGSDDAAFCLRVGDALKEGYVLYGSPGLTHTPDGLMVSQAVVLPEYLPGSSRGATSEGPK